MSQYRIVEGQSIFDVAMQLYGAPEKSIQLIKDNPTLVNLNVSELAGIVVEYTETINDITQQIDNLNRVINTTDPKILTNAQFDDSFDDSFLT